jgi:hypothetical protein
VTLLFRRGATNTTTAPVAEYMSDERGRIALDLPAGTYCVVTADKRELSGSCPEAEALARSCDATFVMPAKRVVVELYISKCFGPCYSGPLPP